MALRVDFGSASFLTTGDLEVDAIPAFVAHHGGSKSIDVDVWEVSHHGSANGTDEQLLHAISPLIATMGTGDPTREPGTFNAFAFGHPRQVVMDQLLDQMTRRRAPVEVPVAEGPRDFRDMTFDEAIYATGWDGTW